MKEDRKAKQPHSPVSITTTFDATPAQLKAGGANLARIGLALKCDKCADKPADSKS